MFDTGASVSSSVLAFVTTVHAGLLVIHVQRARGVWRAVVAVPAAAFAALAWVLTTPAWLAAGLLAHVAWAILAIRLSPPLAGRGSGDAQAAAPPTAAPRPAAAARPGFVSVPVLALIDETPAIRTFRFSRPPGFDFAPGQFLMVKVEIGGQSVARCYSISSSPAASGYLEISVKRQGLVSSALHDTVRPGAMVLIHPPLGRFTVPPGDDRVVLVAGGIGITPLVSILRDLVTTQPQRRITLLYSMRDRRDAAFADELAWLERRHDQLRVEMTVTAGDSGEWRRGRIDARFLRGCVEDVDKSVFLICGPLPMIDDVREMLAALGVAPERVRFEAFEAAAAVAGQAQEAGEAAGRLRLALTGAEVSVQPTETLLDAAERAGARISSFCRAGICGTCRTRLVSGDVRCSAEALTDEERQDGYVLPCQAWPAGDCVLEA